MWVNVTFSSFFLELFRKITPVKYFTMILKSASGLPLQAVFFGGVKKLYTRCKPLPILRLQVASPLVVIKFTAVKVCRLGE